MGEGQWSTDAFDIAQFFFVLIKERVGVPGGQMCPHRIDDPSPCFLKWLYSGSFVQPRLKNAE